MSTDDLKKNQTELSGRSVVGPSHTCFFTVLTAAFFINTIYFILFY